jgi:hypothetical protein
MDNFWVNVLLLMVAFGALGGFISSRGNRSPGEGLVLGGLFGPLGILIVLVLLFVPPKR